MARVKRIPHTGVGTVLAGIAGGSAAAIAMLATFRVIGFGWNGGGILLDPTIQSPKLIAVWTELEPLPLVITRPAVIVAGLLLFGVLHAAVYQSTADVWPVGVVPRAIRMAALLFTLSFAFWEFFRKTIAPRIHSVHVGDYRGVWRRRGFESNAV